jgi:uncharacterized protein YjiS (DUF1127 family)
MTTAILQTNNSQSHNFPRDGFMNRIRVYVARSRASRQLHGLDDRMLADIGLNRGEINASVWGN